MKNLLMGLFLTFTLISCKTVRPRGNGNGAPGYTHNELAEKFVSELNLDGDFSVTLVKKSTLQKNFIVIYDPLNDSYDAINIDNYDPAINNATEYYYDNANRDFFDLDVLPGHYEAQTVWDIVGHDSDGSTIYGYTVERKWIPTRYRDRRADITFEKVSATPKDLAKMAALKEIAEIDKKAQFLSSEFGLSLDRSKEVARLTAHWKKASAKGMSDTENDHFATELLGFSITKAQKAVYDSMDGDSSSLNELVELAASKNNITPEHTTKLMSKIFGLN